MSPAYITGMVLITKRGYDLHHWQSEQNKVHYLQTSQWAAAAAAAAAGSVAATAAVKRNQDAGSRLDKYSPMHDLSSRDKCSHQEKWTLNTLKTQNMRENV